MKKVWKGFAAAVSAAAIAATGFIGATSAYAEGEGTPAPATTGTITVKNAAKDDTFNAYRLLALTTGTGADNTTTYSYKLIPGTDGAYSNETRALVKAINDTNNKTAADQGYLAIPDTSATANQKTKFEQDLIAAINAFKASTAPTDDSANMRTFAKNLIAAVKDTATNSPTKVAETRSATAGKDGDLVLRDLQPGYYLVDHASQKDSTAVTDPNSTSLSAYLVDTVTAGSNTDLTLKNGTVSLVKKVQDWNDTTGRRTDPSWQDSADHDLGDKVPFQLTGTLPDNYDRYDTFNYIFTDTLSPGLTRNNDVKVYAVNGTGKNQTKQEITNSFKVPTVSPQNLTDTPKVGEKFTVGVKNTGTDQAPVYNLKAITKDDKGTNVTIDKDTTIVVEYTATLNDSAVIGSAGNPTKAYLQFSNNPNNGGNGDFGHTPEDTVIVFTYQFDVNKTFSNNPPAANDMPQFTLYKSYPAIPADATEAETATFTKETIGEGANAKTIYWKNIKTVTVQPYQVTENDKPVTKYKAEFPRIDDGNYKVVESRVPQGYNQADDVFFKVEATHTEGAEPALSQLKITVYTDATFTTIAKKKNEAGELVDDVTTPTSGVVGVTIENKSGSELPSTGGMGTTVLYVAGAAIVLIAGIGLAVALRRRQA